MGTYLRVLNESLLVNTNMTSLDSFQNYLHFCAFEKSSLTALEGLMLL